MAAALTPREPATDSLSILLIEDDHIDARLFSEYLRAGGRKFSILHAASIGEAEQYLTDATLDCIVIDMHLPDLSGMEALAAVQAGSVGQPILVLTGKGEIETGIDAVRMGAQDYLFKEELDTPNLLRAILYAIERQRLLSCMRDSARLSATSEANLRSLLFVSTEALVVVGAGGQVYFVNELAEKLFGKSCTTMLCEPFQLTAAPGTETEYRIVRPDLSEITAEARAVHVIWQERSATLISLRDVSERRRAVEQQLRLDLLTDFLNHMSHELRTPLAAIYQFVSNVRDGILGPVNPEQSDQLGRAIRNVDDTLVMISNLLEVARTHAGKLRMEPRMIDLESEVSSVVEVLRSTAHKASIGFETEWPAGLPNVLADPGRVRQIVSNLGENAIKFTPAGGHIRICAQADRQRSRVLLSVEDTGCGVPKDHVDRIFEELHQVPANEHRTRKGLGLGLFITRELVRGLGGEIQVRSEPGRGSRFEIALPMFSFEQCIRGLGHEDGMCGGPLYAVLARLSWRQGSGDDIIPATAITQLRSVFERMVEGRQHVLLPPQVRSHSVVSGLVVRCTQRSAGEACGLLESGFANDEFFRASALGVDVICVPLLRPDRRMSTAKVAAILEHRFRNTHRKEESCKIAA